MTTKNKTACVIGGSGLVGGHLIDQLIETGYSKIITINRKTLDSEDHESIKEVIIEDFDQLINYKEELLADDYFCCLGTTIKKAGTKEKFRKVDYQYVVDFAAIAKEHDANSLSVVTAMGANASSAIFYNKVKGEVEKAVQSMKLNKVIILRPSLILGERKEHRSGEDAAKWIMTKMGFIFKGPFKKYKPVHARQIAKAMIYYSTNSDKTLEIIESNEIQHIS